MSTLGDMRRRLAVALSQVSGLRCYEVIPENPAPPCAVVTWQRVETAVTSGPRPGALQEVAVEVVILAHRVDERTGQQTLDELCSPDHARSVFAAVRADRTLGGAAQDAHVMAVVNTGQMSVGDVPYLSASAQLRVLI